MTVTLLLPLGHVILPNHPSCDDGSVEAVHHAEGNESSVTTGGEMSS